MSEPQLPTPTALFRTRKPLNWGLVGMLLAMTASVYALGAQNSMTQFTHTAWSAKDGVPGPIRAIAQTPDGYLWLGTANGLYRFDGIRFEQFEPSSGEPPHGQAILSLLAARDGSLWMGFGSTGISQLRNGHISHFPPGQGVPEGGTLSIVEDAAGTIWAAGQYGFATFQAGKWHPIGTEMGYPAPGAQSLLVDHEGTLWVATDGFDPGLSKDPVRSNTILTLSKGAGHFSPTGEAVGMVWSMAEAPDGTVWISDASGLSARRIGIRQEASLSVRVGDTPMSMTFGGDGSLWIGLSQGGLRRTGNIHDAEPLEEFHVSDGLSGSPVCAALKDREGNLWFGTGGGLDRFRQNKLTPFSEREGFAPERAMAVTSTPDGSVWFALYSGDTVLRFWHGAFVPSTLRSNGSSDPNRILALYAAPSGEVWLGGNFKLARLSHGSFSYVDVPGVGYRAGVEAVAEDKAGDLWVAFTTNGSTVGGYGQILRRRAGNWTDLRSKVTLPPFRCRVLYSDSDGRMWLGFENGEVAVFEGDGARLFSAKDGLLSGRVLVIAGDRDGHLFVGGDGGLSQFTKDHFVTLTQENGLLGNSVSGILQDEGGNLWLAGTLGILRVTAQELENGFASPSHRLQGLTFDATDGLRGLPRQREPFPTAAKAADGRLWFATTGGVAVIDPRGWPVNTLPPPVDIESVTADDRTLEPSNARRLSPNTKNIEFHYDALSLTVPERVRFRYKLEGYDTEWRGPLSTRTATYTNLPSGSYRFQVIASNNDGIWNEEGAAFDFAILPTFYQRRLFVLLCAVVAGCLVWLAVRWRIEQMRSRLQLQFRGRLMERTRIAQELHDTLLQGFLSASLQLHVATDQLPPESPERSRFDRVLELMRGVIEEGRNAVRGLRSFPGNKADLEESFSQIRHEWKENGDIDLRIIGEGIARPLDATVRDEVYRIGREAVLNALQHSGGRLVEVEVEFAAKELRVAVRDDGRGIDPKLALLGREGHWGITGMRERAKRIGCELDIRTRASAGTEVELRVPGSIAFLGDSPWRWWGCLLRLYPRRARSAHGRK